MTVSNLPLDEAHRLADEMDLLEPAPVSVSLVEEADEVCWRVEAHFASPPDTADVPMLAGRPWSLAPLPQRDWVAASLKGLAPVRAGRFFVHGAHDRGRAPPGTKAIEIEASLAFGTGHHGTTSGCLAALDQLLKEQAPCSRWLSPALDLGCGSGILAIAYAQATRLPVLATDIDPVAVAQASANAIKCRVGPQLAARCAPGLSHPLIRSRGLYRLVMANILAQPLKALAPGLCALLAAGGRVILSGFTHSQEARILAAYRPHGLLLHRRIRIDGWSTLVLGKPRKRTMPRSGASRHCP
ncbi:50S ribosomal protein L11 methyltransferase [Rhodoligotrophos defluvii]|uniref:50S ribosomal protein L11 methyltransferase n=1 Tax=Rhodoligotrophos defluvii TaxID=2561934 RepID=UPI001EEFE03B|nr:50S ribosomal protein L11 methyltransferase [Rhodoligotrophos defluvii]